MKLEKNYAARTSFSFGNLIERNPANSFFHEIKEKN